MTGATSLRHDTLVRLDLLDLGDFDVGPGKRRILIPGFLLTTATGRRLLLDTGFAPAYARDERDAARADGLDSFGRLIGYGPAQSITGALAAHGLTPSDIADVILSHSHIDHVGSLHLFAHAEIWLTATERAEPRPLYFGAARPLAWPAARYRTITRATEVCTGLRLIPTPGHTPGHLSVLAKLPGARLVLAADAINRASEPGEGFPDAMDQVAAATSARRLLRLARREGAEVIFGHDPAQALTLPGRSWT